MNQRLILCVALSVATLGFACGGKKAEKPAGGAGDGSGAGGGAAGGGAAGGGAAGGGNAAGGEVTAAETVKECPKSLAGSEQVNRIITKDCGTVVVTGEYYNDGSLTLEAGSVLAFAPDAAMYIGYGKPAKLVVKGTAEAPVLFTANGDKVPGSWRSVVIYGNASRSTIDHLVVEYGGGDQALLRVEDAKEVSIKGSTFRSGKEVGVKVTGTGTLTELSGCTFDALGKASLDVPAQVAGAIAGDNKFPDGSSVLVQGTPIKALTTWQRLAVPYHVSGEIYVDGESGARAAFVIAGGNTVQFADRGAIYVGFGEPGSIQVSGSAEAPVTFTSADRKEAGAWRALGIYGNGEGTIEGAVFELGSAEAKEGVLHVEGKGAVAVKGCTFRNNTLGVVVDSDEATLRAFENNTFEKSGAALTLRAKNLGAVGAGNTYDDAAHIVVMGGNVEGGAVTWHAQKTAIELANDVQVQGNATVTVEAGSHFVGLDNVELGVGFVGTGSLVLAGTAEAPIMLAGVRDEPAVWHGIRLYANARATTIENVVLRNVGGDAGIKLDGAAEVKVENVTCGKCEKAVVAWDCAGKVTAAGVKAEDGTPAGEVKPTCN